MIGQLAESTLGEVHAATHDLVIGQLPTSEVPFVWSEATGMQSLPFKTNSILDMSADGTTIVGNMWNDNGFLGHIFRDGGFTQIATPFSISPTRVSPSGRFVAGQSLDDLFKEGFIYDGTSVLFLKDSKNADEWSNIYPEGISDTGVIVGHGDYAIDLSGKRAFIWTFEEGFQLLEHELASLGLRSGRLDWARGISADGNIIVGFQTNVVNGPSYQFIADLSVPSHVAGDYNGNGRVEQADLDLVLLNWGDELAAPWVDGIVDQAELDGVLLHWGDTAGAGLAAAVPEPQTAILSIISVMLAAALLYRSPAS